MLYDDEIHQVLDKLYERGFRRGYEKAFDDLHNVKEKLEEMIEFLNTKEGK